jgi:hypothetical protein
MKNPANIVFVFLAFYSSYFAQINYHYNSIPVGSSGMQFTSSNLPIFVIDTQGQEIVNENKITADMAVIYNGDGVRNYLTDPYNNYNGKIGIEIRGSSSQMFPKKQYAVETRDALGNDVDVSLLGFPSESDWILFAPYNDKSLMRDVLAYRIASDMGRYASRSKFCEVILNGEYVGVYVLLEKVKRDANRVNIKKLEAPDTAGTALTGGYIIKIDKTDGEGNDGWYSNYLPYPQTNNKIFYQYHYPNPEDIVTKQKTYIQNQIFNFETVMYYSSSISDPLTGYPKYLDVDSFVDFVLVNETAKNVDGYRLSTYLYKNRDDINPKIFAGPVWDFNLGFGNANYYDGWTTTGWEIEYLTDYQNIPEWEGFLTPFWWKKLYNDNNFRNKVYSRWQDLKNQKLNSFKIISYVDSLTILLDESKTRNFEKWPVLGEWVWPNWFVGQTYQEEILYLKSWVINRLAWLDQNMIGQPTSIDENNNLIPTQFVLEQNYPNPFNPTTRIKYSITASPKSSPRERTLVILKVFDLLGKEVATLVSEDKTAGNYEAEFDASFLTSGVYFYQLRAGDYVETKKMVLMR